jgi:hypothetical protein
MSGPMLVKMKKLEGLRTRSSFTGMEHRHADDLSLFIPDENIVIGQLTVIGMAWLFEIQIEDIGLLIIARPDTLERDMQQLGGQVDNLLNVY